MEQFKADMVNNGRKAGKLLSPYYKKYIEEIKKQMDQLTKALGRE